jgi:uncharacterized protein YgiM (DUF1202 family)
MRVLGERGLPHWLQASGAVLIVLSLIMGPGIERVAAQGGPIKTATVSGSPISIGDNAWVDDGPLNLRASAGPTGEIIDALPTGTQLTILDGPVDIRYLTWFEVELSTGETGWVAGDFLSFGASFGVGDEIEVVDGPLNLRDDSGSSATILTQLQDGDTAVVLSGPVNSGAYSWYEVEVDASTTGWVADQFVALAGSVSFAGGDVIEVTDGPVNLRAGAGLSEGVMLTIADGSTVWVGMGPVDADGLHWYKVWFAFESQAWVAGDFFSVRDVSAPFSIGDFVNPTIYDLNLRSAPGIDAEIIDTLNPYSSIVEVTGGPVAADGYTWYEVSDPEIGDGWVAGELIELYPSVFPIE